MNSFGSDIRDRLRPRAPLPRVACEHVIAGQPTAARVIREQVMLNVCAECWEKQHLLRVTAEGKLVVIETGGSR